jgi:ketosteroid isomerase-like protein
MRLSSRLLASLTLGAVLACNSGPRHDPAADEQAIRDLVTQWNGFLQSRNDSAIVALYDSTGVLLPAGMPAVSGTEQMRAFWAQLWAMNASLSLAPEVVEVSGDLAVERGRWTWSNPLPDGSQATDAGKYLVSWRRVNGQWKVVNDIWNSDNPPPPPAPATR